MADKKKLLTLEQLMDFIPFGGMANARMKDQEVEGVEKFIGFVNKSIKDKKVIEKVNKMVDERRKKRKG